MNTVIVGAATTKFGELWDISPRTLARRALGNALNDAGLTADMIDALFVGNMLSGMLGGQEHLGAFFAEELGVDAPAIKVEGACASGALALHTAVMSVLSGQYETVAVLGVEKMSDHKPEDVARALMGAGSEEERRAGASFPALYALLARAHMQAYGTTEKELASVAVKNHYHARLNPNAQFRSRITVDQVLKSPCVADPLRLLMCSPISDGAAAVIIANDKSAVRSGRQQTKNNKRINIAASAVVTDSLGLSGRASLTELRATQQAARQAYKQAGVEPKDIDVAEVHDCFTIAEILAMEDLGFYEKGSAAGAIARGETALNDSGTRKESANHPLRKRLVVNPSGGLKGCGHPVGATGVKQVVELVDQLLGRAGDRQVNGATVGLAHNVGGSGATAVIHILKKE